MSAAVVRRQCEYIVYDVTAQIIADAVVSGKQIACLLLDRYRLFYILADSIGRGVDGIFHFRGRATGPAGDTTDIIGIHNPNSPSGMTTIISWLDLI